MMLRLPEKNGLSLFQVDDLSLWRKCDRQNGVCEHFLFHHAILCTKCTKYRSVLLRHISEAYVIIGDLSNVLLALFRDENSFCPFI